MHLSVSVPEYRLIASIEMRADGIRQLVVACWRQVWRCGFISLTIKAFRRYEMGSPQAFTAAHRA